MTADDVIEAFADLAARSRAHDVGDLMELIGVAPGEVDRVISMVDLFVRVRAGDLDEAVDRVARECWLDGFAVGVAAARYVPPPR